MMANKTLGKRIGGIGRDLFLNSSEKQLVKLSSNSSHIPQGSVVEQNLQSFKLKQWREHFSKSLQGEGIEIGALNRPLEKHSGMSVKYVDQYPIEKLREVYPELDDKNLVEPDILDNAETLASIDEGSFDFVIAAHVIEHMKNPIKSVENWLRVVKPGGQVYIVVPDKRASFDKTRVRTSLEHLILDYHKPSGNRDFEHYLDYARNVLGHQGKAAISEADKLAADEYSIHFHVFMPSDVLKMLAWVNDNLCKIEIDGPAMAPSSHEFHFLLTKTS